MGGLTSCVSALAGSMRISNDCAVASYVGLVVVGLSVMSIMMICTIRKWVGERVRGSKGN